MNKKTTRREELEEHIAQLEDSLEDLKLILKQEIEKEQHEAIDNLEHYLSAVDHRYVNLRAFWQVVQEEIREAFKPKKTES